MKFLQGLGAPLLAAVIWGAFVAPKARRRAHEPWRLLIEIAVFGAASAALWAVGQPALAIALAAVYAFNRFWLVRSGSMGW